MKTGTEQEMELRKDQEIDAEAERGSRDKERRVSNRSLILLIAVLIGAGVIVGAIQYSLYRYVKANDDGSILNGISIAGVDVSGMQEKDAKKAVEAQIEKYTAKQVEFNVDDVKKIKIQLKDLEVNAKNIDEAIQEAVDYGKSESLTETYKIIKQSKKGKIDHKIDIFYKAKKSDIYNILYNETQECLEQPVNASVTQKDGKVEIESGKKGKLPNIDEAYKKLLRQLNDGWKGTDLNIAVSIQNTDPKITEEALTDVTDLLGSFTTEFGTDNENRVMNIETGAKHCSNILLQPGETVSANELTEPFTAENGYAMGGSYESNKIVESMGGGICQVTTTLYDALLYAELEIVERHPHSMLVAYVEPAKDAAIAENLLDFVFKNNQKYPIFIESVVEDGKLTFNVYGKETRPEGRSIEFVSTSEQKEAPTTVRYVSDENSSIGVINYQSSAQPEIDAQLEKIIYQDGEEQSREIVNYSTYQEVPETYAVGTASDNPEDTARMITAIQSQDEETIQSAINEIIYQ